MKIKRIEIREIIESLIKKSLIEAQEGETVYYDEDSDGKPDDTYEYKSEDGIWYTRKAGTSGRWIDMSPYPESIEKLNRLYPDLAMKIDRDSSRDEETRSVEKGIPDFRTKTQGTMPAAGLNDVDGVKEYMGEGGNALIVFNTANTTDNPKVILFYPGIGSAGEQSSVIKMIKRLPPPTNTVMIIVNRYDTPIGDLVDVERKLNFRTSNRNIGGWSRGAEGLANALEQDSGTRFRKIIYADPSPGFLLGKDHSPNAKMYYRTDNWKRRYPELAVKLDALAAEMGSRAEEVNRSHSDIAKKALLELMFGR